jgi:hypothetical protein
MIDNAYIDEVCRLLRLHETNIQEYMVDCVASICDVDKLDMMTNVSNLNTIHSRWLFWYAYRYMTNEPFIRISNITLRYGKKFTEQSIANCVNKMGNMIASETIWTKRWAIIRRIIKLRDKTAKSDLQDVIKVVVHHPKNVEIKLKEE